jgi:tetratricopeptide (TPR) repeat protein
MKVYMEEKYYWADKQGNVYGPFGMDKEGNPLSGEVVEHFRIKKGMSRKAFGKALDKTARWVQLMESTNTAPELISRRKAIARMLGIPFFLLGLASDEDLIRLEETTHPQIALSQQKPAATKVSRQRIDIRAHAEMLPLYWNVYYTGTIQSSLSAIEEKIRQLRILVPEVYGKSQADMLTLLCQYRQLASTIARDRRDYQKAYEHLNVALKIAERLNNKSLLAATLFRRGLAYFEQDDLTHAILDLDKACSLKDAISSILGGRILLTTGNAYAHSPKKDVAKEGLQLLDQAGSVVHSGRVEPDEHFLSMSLGRYHLNRAEALIAMGNLLDAEDELQEAHEHVAPDQTRRHNYIDTLEARLAIDARNYIVATSTALRAFEVAKVLQSETNMANIVRVYQQLLKSPYAKHKDVQDLGHYLTNWAEGSLASYL